MDHVFDRNTAAEPSMVSGVFTPLADAVAEIQRNRADNDLLARVRAYLHDDIPDYLDGSQPTLYLSRHVVTPNLSGSFIALSR